MIKHVLKKYMLCFKCVLRGPQIKVGLRVEDSWCKTWIHWFFLKIISTSISKTEMQMNPDADDKLESVNLNNTITSCNAISSFNDSENIHNIQSNNLCIDQGELKN